MIHFILGLARKKNEARLEDIMSEKGLGQRRGSQFHTAPLGGASLGFATGSVVTFLLLVFWWWSAEAWETTGDGAYYLALFKDYVSPAPWGYRILGPALAWLLPWKPIVNFEVIATATLALAGGVLALMSSGQRRETSLFTCVLLLFWGSSYALVYSGTTFVRADPLLLLGISVFYAATNSGSSLPTLWLLLAIGVLAHELMLIALRAMWLDKLFEGDLTGGKTFRLAGLFRLSIAGLTWLTVIRKVIPVDGAVGPYRATPVEMVGYALAYSGGWGKHLLRIYASYGPAILFAMAYVVRTRKRAIALPFAGLCGVAFVLSLMATDTLRVMSVLYLPVLYYAAKYVETFWLDTRAVHAVFCIGIQLAYSLIVYGHLRTFEKSAAMKAAAAAFSVAAAVACLSLPLKRAGFGKRSPLAPPN